MKHVFRDSGSYLLVDFFIIIIIIPVRIFFILSYYYSEIFRLSS